MIFKSGGVAACLFAAAFSSVTCGLTAAEQPQQAEYVFHGAGNPYLPLWEHLPDGEPRVFEDPDNPGKYRFCGRPVVYGYLGSEKSGH